MRRQRRRRRDRAFNFKWNTVPSIENKTRPVYDVKQMTVNYITLNGKCKAKNEKSIKCEQNKNTIFEGVTKPLGDAKMNTNSYIYIYISNQTYTIQCKCRSDEKQKQRMNRLMNKMSSNRLWNPSIFFWSNNQMHACNSNCSSTRISKL